jgi:hypothetical protein
MGASTDTRETIQKLVEVNREASQAAVKAVQTWTTATPFAETFKRTMEAFTPPATSARAKKSPKAEEAAV